MCIVRVRRNHLVEDALDEIARQYRRDLFKPLRVHFIGEEGIDAGGVKKEFFQLLVAELLSPDYGMLVYQPESHTYWFNACSLEGEEQFMLLGLVLGLAIYNRVLLDFPLPLALYKKLLQQSVGLRDLEDMQPTLGRSLRQLLQYEGPDSVEDTFCLTFSVEMDFFGDLRTISLKPGGEDLPVTEETRHEYVDLMVDYLLNRSIHRQFEAFFHGFRILCDGPAIRLFNACEVERLVCGNPNLDFAALERNAKYEGGFSAASTAVQWLWGIVRDELSFDEKKMYLKFFTGSDRSPIGGLGSLKCVIQRDGPDSSKLPTSHTCFNTLLLPEYATREKMADRLRLAILNAEGFGLE
ncbi:ubiquitin-protein ligase E3 A [Monoraphidium neglectum]|uniref:HECT-type E3 ubiquitin transferase n=1 Tax=Monoraphidium neglectum TaxID=145388 RepID=A0A0D2MEU0_9CHLO|nr:ubiquitin-protein ligase E3 A [Monoraphidium neglectum]KIY99241.1 ubiquitin-protein ligase E3 A [Monoraphidium neglectum]|eukprot:XP_013898261.1 ubiquitin-protein ligase E3 A [Monoraphidium neglectum]